MGTEYKEISEQLKNIGFLNVRWWSLPRTKPMETILKFCIVFVIPYAGMEGNQDPE